jgi:hypothetical protein
MLAVDCLARSSEVDDGVFNAAQPPPALCPCRCRPSPLLWPDTARSPGIQFRLTALRSPTVEELHVLSHLPPPLLPPPIPTVARLTTAASPGSYTPFLNAMLSPAKAPPRRPRHPFCLPPAPSRCFRCLTADHQVRDCRDPVRCRGCSRFGHRHKSCPMPIARVLTPHPRCCSSSPAPAPCVPVSAAPSLRSPRCRRARPPPPHR